MNRLYWVCTLVLTVGTFLGTAYVYDSLPDQFPIHWNASGKVDGTMAKPWGPFLSPLMMLGVIGLFAALPWLSPGKFSVESFRTTYLFIMVLIAMLFAYIQFLSLYAATHPKVDVAKFLIAGIGLMFAAMGNVMGRVKRNFYIGIRTPWTLASDRVWNDTHRIGAWSFVAGGLLMFLVAVTGLPVYLSMLPILPAALGPVVYSLLHYKRLEKQGLLEVSEIG